MDRHLHDVNVDNFNNLPEALKQSIISELVNGMCKYVHRSLFFKRNLCNDRKLHSRLIQDLKKSHKKKLYGFFSPCS